MERHGWGKRGTGVPLADRARPGGRVPVPDGPACPARHCWVVDAAGVKRPGLLVEWRRGVGVGPGSGDAPWEGRVAYVSTVRAETWALVEEWLPAAQLLPGDGA